MPEGSHYKQELTTDVADNVNKSRRTPEENSQPAGSSPGKRPDWTLLIRKIPPAKLFLVKLAPLEDRVLSIFNEDGYKGMNTKELAKAAQSTEGTVRIAKTNLKKKLSHLLQNLEKDSETASKEASAKLDVFNPELRKLWASLIKHNAPAIPLASFERYLSDDKPMTGQQMEAACKAMAKFPNHTHVSYRPLADHIMNIVHRRYKNGDGQEKQNLEWVASTLFTAIYLDKFQREFDLSTNGAGGNYHADLLDTLHKSVHDALEKGNSNSILPLMQTVAKQDIIDLKRTIFGRINSPHKEVRYNHQVPERLEDLELSGRPASEIIPSDAPTPLETLLLQEKIDTIENLKNSPPSYLTPGEAKFLKHYINDMKNVDIEKGKKDPFLERIAAKMGLTPSRITQLRDSTFEKLRQYPDVNPAGEKSSSRHQRG